jgi:hypothetical protein
MNDDTKADLTRAFCLSMELWSRRHEVDPELIPPPPEGPNFDGAPAVVSMVQLMALHTAMMELAPDLLPELYAQLTEDGAVPDAPLPDPERKVVDLSLHRIRIEEEFQDEQVAYLEALWGKGTFAFNVAVRDLELMRRDRDDGSLRPPETYHEALHMILHVRALANDLARHFGMPDQVRAEDDIPQEEDEK